MNVQEARARGHLPVGHSPLVAAFANAPPKASPSAAESPGVSESPARSVVQSRKLSEAAKEKLDEVWADAVYEMAMLLTVLGHPAMRKAINATADLGRSVIHMKDGQYVPPNRKRLAEDLLDKAEEAERSDVGKRMRTSTVPNETGLALNEHPSSHSCITT